MAKTLFDKVWENHFVTKVSDDYDLIYIDRHLVHEVTSPQAFDGLRLANRKVRRPDLTFATVDHNIPTTNKFEIKDKISKQQVETLSKNCEQFEIPLFGLDSDKQGIVHVIGPELGITLPGTTIVCGDSHTSTHGAFGALAFGIGTSEVEHVLATQCLQIQKPKNYLVKFYGSLMNGVTSKDMILKLIAQIGTGGATGYVIEYMGDAISNLSMEARMTICNMSIEAGARAGMIAPDAVTFDYFKNQERLYAPKGKKLDDMIFEWESLKTDAKAKFDHIEKVDLAKMAPQITWGTSPSMVIGIDEPLPDVTDVAHVSADDAQKAYEYMGLEAGKKLSDYPIDVVFIGSCTNSRIEDLRAAAKILKGKTVKSDVETLIVPGSEMVKKQAEAEGLDQIFKDAGASWRSPGCSMCLAMNPDKLKDKQRCASTSNRNFEGRQGQGGRTHLVSPEMAALASVYGHFVDAREEV